MSALDSPFPVHELDSKLIPGCVRGPDAIEGVLSFPQRRNPDFTGTAPKDLPDYLPWR
jgi:hypothetical protein